MFRILRIAVLLYLLAFVAVGALVDSAESTNWDFGLRVVVYPVAGSDSPAVMNYIDSLSSDDFDRIETFLAAEAERYGLALHQPFELTLAPERDISIPEIPPRASRLRIVAYSLRMRLKSLLLAWSSDAPPSDITVFAVFHDPQSNPVLETSTALRKGLIAVANIFADPQQARANDVVIAHELLHTLGATDKYSFATLQPNYPDGYAEPNRDPLHPQRFAEIMAGRIAVSEQEVQMPASLRRVRVGPQTAAEIGWPALSDTANTD